LEPHPVAWAASRIEEYTVFSLFKVSNTSVLREFVKLSCFKCSKRYLVFE